MKKWKKWKIDRFWFTNFQVALHLLSLSMKDIMTGKNIAIMQVSCDCAWNPNTTHVWLRYHYRRKILCSNQWISFIPCDWYWQWPNCGQKRYLRDCDFYITRYVLHKQGKQMSCDKSLDFLFFVPAAPSVIPSPPLPPVIKLTLQFFNHYICVTSRK